MPGLEPLKPKAQRRGAHHAALVDADARGRASELGRSGSQIAASLVCQEASMWMGPVGRATRTNLETVEKAKSMVDQTVVVGRKIDGRRRSRSRSWAWTSPTSSGNLFGCRSQAGDASARAQGEPGNLKRSGGS